MKYRRGFVSNSSSTCFTVVPAEAVNEPIRVDNLDTLEAAFRKEFGDGPVTLFELGRHDFDWAWIQYDKLSDKWNWLAMQAVYAKLGRSEYVAAKATDEYMRRLDNLVMWMGLSIDWDKIEDCTHKMIAYIDHQSVCPEVAFRDAERVGIERFLLDGRCYVQGGNDNEMPPDDDIESARDSRYFGYLNEGDDYEN